MDTISKHSKASETRNWLATLPAVLKTNRSYAELRKFWYYFSTFLSAIYEFQMYFSVCENLPEKYYSKTVFLP